MSLFSTKIPESSPSFNFAKTENQEIAELMFRQSDEEIIKLAEEMNIPVEKESETKLKNKSATIAFLIKGGCPNCGKKRV